MMGKKTTALHNGSKSSNRLCGRNGRPHATQCATKPGFGRSRAASAAANPSAILAPLDLDAGRHHDQGLVPVELQKRFAIILTLRGSASNVPAFLTGILDRRRLSAGKRA